MDISLVGKMHRVWRKKVFDFMLMNSIVLDPPYSLMYYLCIFPYGTALYTDNKSPMLLGTVYCVVYTGVSNI